MAEQGKGPGEMPEKLSDRVPVGALVSIFPPDLVDRVIADPDRDPRHQQKQKTGRGAAERGGHAPQCKHQRDQPHPVQPFGESAEWDAQR